MTPMPVLQGVSKLAADASVFLIVGGLCMLGLVVVLVVLRTAFPTGKPPAGGMIEGPQRRRIAPTPPLREPPPGPAATAMTLNPHALAQGAEAARRLKPDTLDAILDHVSEQRWGLPRVLRLRSDSTIVRYYQCADCDGDVAPSGAGCGFQAGFLRAGLEHVRGHAAKVRERVCRAHGDPACEFEVRFA